MNFKIFYFILSVNFISSMHSGSDENDDDDSRSNESTSTEVNQQARNFASSNVADNQNDDDDSANSIIQFAPILPEDNFDTMFDKNNFNFFMTLLDGEKARKVYATWIYVNSRRSKSGLRFCNQLNICKNSNIYKLWETYMQHDSNHEFVIGLGEIIKASELKGMTKEELFERCFPEKLGPYLNWKRARDFENFKEIAENDTIAHQNEYNITTIYEPSYNLTRRENEFYTINIILSQIQLVMFQNSKNEINCLQLKDFIAFYSTRDRDKSFYATWFYRKYDKMLKCLELYVVHEDSTRFYIAPIGHEDDTKPEDYTKFCKIRIKDLTGYQSEDIYKMLFDESKFEEIDLRYRAIHQNLLLRIQPKVKREAGNISEFRQNEKTVHGKILNKIKFAKTQTLTHLNILSMNVYNLEECLMEKNDFSAEEKKLIEALILNFNFCPLDQLLAVRKDGLEDCSEKIKKIINAYLIIFQYDLSKIKKDIEFILKKVLQNDSYGIRSEEIAMLESIEVSEEYFDMLKKI